MILIDHLGMGVFNSYITFKRIGKKILFLGIIFSIICDIDIFWSGNPGSISYMRYHRVWSHSLVIILPVMVITSLFLKLIKFRFLYDITPKELIIMQLLGFGTHILLDLLTPFGVPLFYPFSDYRYSFDLLHDFDPITSALSIISIVLVIFFRKKKLNKRLVATLGLSYLVYLLFVVVNKHYQQAAFLEQSVVADVKEIKMIPKTFWRWKGILISGDQYILINNASEVESLQTLTTKMIEHRFRNQEMLTVFLKYARFPAIQKMNDTTIQFYNLAYSKENYKLTTTLDSNNHIKSYNITSFDLVDR